MSTTQTSADDADLRRFRAATVEAALADARAELGDIEIVEANRIRRGGVGGFFATDLGVELVVRPPGQDATERAIGRCDTGAAVDLLDSEYVDSAAVGRVLSEPLLPRASDRATDDRPPFYDRVREEDVVPAAAPQEPAVNESITAELERLLTDAAAAERLGAGSRPMRTFASHLAEHLDRPASDDSPRAPRHAAPHAGEPDPTGTNPDDTAGAPTQAKQTRRSTARTATGRDPWRKSVDLAAGAVGRLVEQLSDVAPVEGSRMRTLSRLTVSVTTPDGAVIELTAELEGDA